VTFEDKKSKDKIIAKKNPSPPQTARQDITQLDILRLKKEVISEIKGELEL
jgi:hypothetical protein